MEPVVHSLVEVDGSTLMFNDLSNTGHGIVFSVLVSCWVLSSLSHLNCLSKVLQNCLRELSEVLSSGSSHNSQSITGSLSQHRGSILGVLQEDLSDVVVESGDHFLRQVFNHIAKDEDSNLVVLLMSVVNKYFSNQLVVQELNQVTAQVSMSLEDSSKDFSDRDL